MFEISKVIPFQAWAGP